MTCNTIYDMNISIAYITRTHRFSEIYWFEVLIGNTRVIYFYLQHLNKQVYWQLRFNKLTNTTYITGTTYITRTYSHNSLTLIQTFYMSTNIRRNSNTSRSDYGYYTSHSLSYLDCIWYQAPESNFFISVI